jgi:hypothetical protein
LGTAKRLLYYQIKKLRGKGKKKEDSSEPTSEEADGMTEEEERADFEEIRDILEALFKEEER